MCDPVTATLVLTAATAGVTAYGTYKQTQAANAAAEYQSQVAANNQLSANQYAADAEKRAKQEADDHKRRIAAVKADQRASIAAAGFDVGQGSALDILSDTEAAGQLDILRIKDAGDREASKYRQQGANFGAESQLYANSKTSPFLAAGTSLLQGASQFGNQYSQFKSVGAIK